MTVMQKAVTPQMSAAYLESGYDRVAGFVVRAGDVAWATTPAAVFEAHGLAFPGAPFRADMEHVDVLRFPAGPTMRFVNATGGTDQRTRELTGGPFVDRPPFTGLGFVAVADHVVPLSWLEHTRIPAGSELVRIGRDGSSTVIGRYVDVGHGWTSDVVTVGPPRDPRISRFVGHLVEWNGGHLSADVLDDRAVLALEVEPRAELGFTRTAIGRWRREVPLTELGERFELHVSGRWNGLEVRLVDQWPAENGGTVSRAFYTGHNADLAEGLQLVKVDAAAYEVVVPTENVVDVVPTQLIPQGWS